MVRRDKWNHDFERLYGSAASFFFFINGQLSTFIPKKPNLFFNLLKSYLHPVLIRIQP